MNKKSLFFLTVILLLTSCSDELNKSLDYSGVNRPELEKVLEHFKEDSNPLKYRAACFIIENIPYHHTLYDDRAKKYEEAYITMATDAMEFHDSVIAKETEKLGGVPLTRPELLTIKADYLIKAINDACDTWEEVNWNKDYDESLFFNYVLPYRIYGERVSDWHEAIKRCFPYLNANIVYSEKGVQLPAYKASVVNAKVIDSPNSTKGKAVQIDETGSSS